MNDPPSSARARKSSIDSHDPPRVTINNSIDQKLHLADRPSPKQIRYAIGLAQDLGVFAGSDPWNLAVGRIAGRSDRLLPHQLSKWELSRVIDAIKKMLEPDRAKVKREHASEISHDDDPWVIR
tara:strand:- start:476 stop:847 length:372 start_codon:yes stop_codon:yes gene_type:complete